MVTTLWTPIFERLMARPGVENKYPIDTHCNEIELCAQHIDIVLGYIVNPM